MVTKALRFAVAFLMFLAVGDLKGENLGLAQEAQALQTVTLQIEGMSCGMCVKEVRSALSKVPGVKATEVKVGKKWFFFNDYSDARAVVTCEQGKTTVAELIKAVEAASSVIGAYKARQVE